MNGIRVGANQPLVWVKSPPLEPSEADDAPWTWAGTVGEPESTWNIIFRNPRQRPALWPVRASVRGTRRKRVRCLTGAPGRQF